MRTVILIGTIVIVLVLGKIYVFPKSESEKAGGNSGGKSSGKSAGAAAIPVSVYVVGMESLDNQIFASGTILPNEEVTLMSEISGRLVKLNIQEGSSISKGQLIAKINDRDLKAQLQKVE